MHVKSTLLAMSAGLAVVGAYLPAAATTPLSLTTLKAGFQPGRWSVSNIGERASSGTELCITSAERLLTRGRAANACNFTVITDTENETIVTYRCKGGLSGRTALRRDMADLYTMEAQGIENGMPFASRTEWRRIGNCQRR